MSSDVSRKRPSLTPLAGVPSFHEEYDPAVTFTPDDVVALIKTAGIIPVKGFRLTHISRRLQSAMFAFVDMPPVSAAPGARHKWARQLRDRAHDLLALLNVDPQTGHFRRVDAAFLLREVDDSATNPILAAMRPYLFVAGLSDEQLADEFAIQTDESRPAFDKRLTIESCPEDFPVPDHFTTLLLTNLGVAYVAKMADSVAKVSGEAKRRKKQPNLAEVNLVGELWQIYPIISGQEATLTLDGPAIKFCCAVADMAHKRLPEKAPQYAAGFDKIGNSLTELANNPSIVQTRIRDFRAGGHRARSRRKASPVGGG